MKSEELRHRIKLQKNITQTDDNGFETETWADFKELWAKTENLHGREYFEAAAVQAENTVKFTIRYTDEIDTAMRIIFRGKQYNITSIDNIKYNNKFIEIKALEVEASG
ncbi:phage head closure protein [Clostridium sp. SYSU_GA19001]|uniref:phage head closure protein n=1 Tax=Clostridium caldaquaticum TaxID=2940653 RepID=UPI002076F444|nr:phage head closure protein [Clostridium caldaquaticum]MCM8710849.1 phage head closure protein [Clostridium caldaquaticum]